MNLVEVIAWLVIAGTCLFLIWQLDRTNRDLSEVNEWWTNAISALADARDDIDQLVTENRELRTELHRETPAERSASIRRLVPIIRK